MSSTPANTDSPQTDSASPEIEKTEDALWRRPPEADLPDLVALHSGSLSNWDEPWDGDLPDDEELLRQMGITVEIHTRWWGFELHCSEPAVRYLERLRRTIFRVVSRVLPPPIPQLVAIYLRVRAVIIRLMSRRGNGLRFLSPWIMPLMLSPRPLPPPGEADRPVVDDEKMRWTVFDPRNSSSPWSDPELFPAHHSAASPALAEHQGKLYCVYRGPTGDTALSFCTYTPEDGWSDGQQLPFFSHRSEASPAIVEYQGALHCIYIQEGTRRMVWVRFVNGRWEQPHFEFSEIITSQSGPSLVATNGRIYCFYESFAETSRQIQYIEFEGMHFRSRRRVPIFNPASAPAAVLSGNRIVCVWASQDNSSLFGSSFDPRNDGVWSDQHGIRFGTQQSRVKPALALYENVVYCVHSGLDQRLWLGTVSPQGAPQTGPTAFPPLHESFVEPGLIVYQDTNMHGHRDSQLMAVYRGTRR